MVTGPESMMWMLSGCGGKSEQEEQKNILLYSDQNWKGEVSYDYDFKSELELES